MANIMFPPAVSALLAGLSLAALSPASLADHSWGGYHWARTTSQFALQLGDNMGGDWKPFLYQTSSDWNNNGDTPVLTSVVDGTSNKRCAMVTGTSQVCNGKYGYNGWLGLATINIVNGTHITQGSAKMNDSYFNLAKYNNPNEKLHVVCQEVAHTFGLAHQSENGESLDTCMDYFSNTGANAGSTSSTRPNAHDFEQLKIIYTHTDTITTVATGSVPAKPGKRPDKAVADISDDPGSWGRLISQSANGRSSTYERHNPDGSKTVTHVYWTEEAASKCRSCDHRFDRHD